MKILLWDQAESSRLSTKSTAKLDKKLKEIGQIEYQVFLLTLYTRILNHIELHIYYSKSDAMGLSVCN
jgi:hypothetical protein